MYYNLPTIDVREENEFFGLPREFVKEGHRWIKHVSCPNSRHHVWSYSLVNEFPNKNRVKVTCSEPDCITNATFDELKTVMEKDE